ncbi:hypothetical protein HYT18_04870 [Candidatus Microgenomates bacterium]|nr:hypothetical protein [Candidatus Microgenomates bacterium]
MADTSTLTKPVSTGPTEIINKRPFQPPAGAVGWEGFFTPSERSYEVNEGPVEIPMEDLLKLPEHKPSMSSSGSIPFHSSPSISVIENPLPEPVIHVASEALGWVGDTVKSAPQAIGEGLGFMGDMLGYITAGRDVESYTNPGIEQPMAGQPASAENNPQDPMPAQKETQIINLRNFFEGLKEKRPSESNLVKVGDQVVTTEQFLETVGLSPSLGTQNVIDAKGGARIDLAVTFELETGPEVVKARRETTFGLAIGQTGVVDLDGKKVFEAGSVLSSITATG